MKEITATRRQTALPEWAVLERQLIRTMNQTPEFVLEKYTNLDGSMLWPTDPNYTSTDALDDMYESFHNWPLFYFAGGDEKFLTYSHRQFDAITEQFTHYSCGHGHPIVVKEYEQGYDWMHQGEGYEFFYLLNLADPENPKNRERSLRFAGFLLNEDPDAINYDPEHKVLKSCYLGSMGAAGRNFDGTPWMWADWKQWYGLPFHDLPGITTVDEMHDEKKAKRMAEAMRDRLAHSDTLVNLMSTSMVMNAFLHTGQDKYREWILEYTKAWRQRTAENGGLVPDNAGPDGKIGSEMNGKWYGGYYGWTWPHGFYFLADALTIACENEALLTGQTKGCDWIRSQYQQLLKLAIEKDGTFFIPQKHGDPGAIQEYHVNPEKVLCMDDSAKTTDNPSFSRLVEKDGWYEFMPLPQTQPIHLWFLSRQPEDFGFIWKTRDFRGHDWQEIKTFYSKFQGEHDLAWLNYLQGGFPDYPEKILLHNLKQTCTRMKEMDEDTEPPEEYTDSYLQKRNPITMEGLVQLTMGGPLPIYNGGLLEVSVCYFDPENRRPGLPEDVAALVKTVDASGICLELHNLHPIRSRKIVVQAGAFSEHNFQKAEADGKTYSINDCRFAVTLPGNTEITLRLEMDRYCNTPTYHRPF